MEKHVKEKIKNLINSAVPANGGNLADNIIVGSSNIVIGDNAKIEIHTIVIFQNWKKIYVKFFKISTF